MNSDFPKALYLCTFLEIVLFTIGGAVGYHFIGDEYMVSPACKLVLAASATSLIRKQMVP